MNDTQPGAMEHLSRVDSPGGDAVPSESGTTDAAQASSPRASSSSMLRELVETVVLALVIFFLIRIFVQNFRVDGMSMEPNFHDGQFLLISKLAYRLGEPQRGDVIVFRYPRDPSRDFIKRVVGLPGETVEIVDGQVYVNGQAIQELQTIQHAAYNSGPVTLSADEVYVMGDNRPNSSDSHSWGPLSTDLIIGKVVLSYWPPNTWGLVKTPEIEGDATSAETSSP